MEYSDDLVQKFQEYHKNASGEDVSKGEANLALGNLVGLFDLLWKMDIEDKKREAKLVEFPKGYALMDGKIYSCFLCGMSITNEELWYDKWGIKCLLCQDAINKKVIPGSACKDRESRYSAWEFEHYFKLSAPQVRALVKKGVLRDRKVLKETERTHVQIFLLKDNKNVLPPKDILKPAHIPQEDKSFRVVQWYDFQEPAEVLKAYKLLPHLETLAAYCAEKPLKPRK